MKRDILNFENIKVGELELPDGTSENVWEEKLAPYKMPPLSLQEIQEKALNISIKQRKDWAEQMLERFKKRNILLGINGVQALWLHHRMRALDINFMSVPMTLDILNMAISGDVETACLAIMFSTPDDGSQPFHFYKEAEKEWLTAEMKSFLGWL